LLTASTYDVAGKNVVINGGMDFSQRATTSGATSASGYLSVDRWYFTPGSAGNVTYAKTQTSTYLPTGFQNALLVTNGTTTQTVGIFQTIETSDTIPLTSQTVSLSFWAASTIASTMTAILGYSSTVDNATTGTWTSISTFTTSNLTTTMTRYSTTFAVPAASSAQTLRINFTTPSLTNGATFSITGVQLELGSTATAFSRAGGSIGGELALCYRFFQLNGLGWTGQMISASTATINGFFKTRMRANPTISTPATGSLFQINVGALTGANYIGSNHYLTTNGVSFDMNGMTGGTTNSIVSPTNDFIWVSAEL
jgi:hypothetical protein